MTYVTDQTSQELRAHMRRLKAMKGWNEPLSDRLYKEILELDKEVSKLRAAQAAQAAQVPIYQYQLANGNWIDQTKESHDYNVRHGQATVRILYAAPSTKEGQQ